ncbi:uncharacterized protein BP01DRAFT_423822 [Aspergillus saccharolyticus JOP 1030-1]|uniref:Ras-GEF domain-containing protein n=1 Tax=Aspergillus saccharolyticus JOP 1030-1 TaxID=1450539 RepID=A0A318ZBX8_9EURO|nr:hypothetical protein BP01DRAFT_423822 [Aspergillus saccharolyticus JOP 1030-1]PYH44925.1 hypothetical protein BP01DRAFT_423822 [Aspergillus saccharolyticus JOP 1030-1]
MSTYSPSSTGMPVMSDPPVYPSIFRAEAEIATFYPKYRWWEDEAMTMLWAFDIQEIKRAIRFGLFRDENTPRTTFQNRNAAAIDDFLSELVGPQESLFIGNLSHVQKVEEILRRCRNEDPTLESWSWFPAQGKRSMTAIGIADDMDNESHVHFTRVPFEALVRYSLGYSAPLVDWFLQQHTALYIHLLHHLRAFPEEVSLYIQVEQHLRTRSPFAHRAVVMCLRSLRKAGQLPASPPTPAFDFIAGPIQQLFNETAPSLKSVLKVLCVSAMRFKQTYVHTRQMDWSRPFQLNLAFLEDLTASTSPLDFASTMSHIDEGYLTGLTHKSFSEPGPVVKRVFTEWELLSIAVWECCTALPDLVGYIQECVQALLAVRNYHSLTAIIDGLRKYSITTCSSYPASHEVPYMLPPEFEVLLDPSDNFLGYREAFNNSPGVPFLVPHIREFQQHGPPAIQLLFRHMRPSPSR